MRNRLFLGFSDTIELPPGGFLFIHDEVPAVARARVFDPTRSSFNPLSKITYRAARDLANVLYAIAPQGENTLTVRNGKRALLKAFLHPKTRRLDKLKTDDAEVEAMIDDLLASPVIRHALCEPMKPFSFRPNSKILARINRAELGDFDALVLGLMLIAHYPGQLVIPDFGFYGRAAHANLIRQKRLIAGVRFLGELPTQLRPSVLAIGDKVPTAVLHEDAETLAKYAGYSPHTNGFEDFVREAMAPPSFD